MEDVHRAGGIIGILKELDKAGKLHTNALTIHSGSLKEAIAKWDIANSANTEAIERFKAAPGACAAPKLSRKTANGKRWI